jgi:rare lipoprotein A
MNRLRSTALTLGALMLAACATPPPGRSPAPGTGAARPVPGTQPGASAQASAARRGGYYLDDGPGDAPPADLAVIPDAQPRLEPLHRWANRPYVVFDRQYVPMTRLEPFRERGVGSWYGRKFHGQRTASGEVYDMYAMTAAHPTLPIPSYVRVTHTRSGRSVVVRVNDRGPFLHGRVIDLSWTAAAKLGYAQGGSGEVEVELVVDPVAFADAPAAGARAGTAATPALWR